MITLMALIAERGVSTHRPRGDLVDARPGHVCAVPCDITIGTASRTKHYVYGSADHGVYRNSFGADPRVCQLHSNADLAAST